MVTKLRLTPMGVLEVAMWSGGAAAVLGFWLLSPMMTEKPAPKRPAAERGTSAAALFSAPASPEPKHRLLQEWEEQFRKATASIEAAPKRQDGRSDQVAVTGSYSPAPSTDPLEAKEIAVVGAYEWASEVPPVEALAPSQEVHADLSEPPENTPGQPVLETALSTPPETVPLSEPEPSLDILGMTETKVAAATLDLALASEGGAVDGPLEGAASSEPPHVTVPEVELVLADAPPTKVSEQAPARTETAAPAASPGLRGPGRDALVVKGEEMLARGDVSGARLLFQRAAESGDARAATGMARTFDPKVLRMLRVYGVRPDPDQAAQWYARSKALEMVASTH